MSIQTLTKWSLGTIVTTLALTSSHPVFANIIYNNGSPNQIAATFSDFDFFQQTADNFLLNTPVLDKLQVNWWGAYSPNNTPPATDNFTLRIFDNDGLSLSRPVVTPFYQVQVGNQVNRIATGQQVSTNLDEFSYSTIISGLSLSAGTNYWLSIVNDTASGTDDDWAWSNSSTSGNARIRATDASSWITSVGREMAFNLATVPEPSSVVALVSLGLLGLLYRHKMP